MIIILKYTFLVFGWILFNIFWYFIKGALRLWTEVCPKHNWFFTVTNNSLEVLFTVLFFLCLTPHPSGMFPDEKLNLCIIWPKEMVPGKKPSGLHKLHIFMFVRTFLGKSPRSLVGILIVSYGDLVIPRENLSSIYPTDNFGRFSSIPRNFPL